MEEAEKLGNGEIIRSGITNMPDLSKYYEQAGKDISDGTIKGVEERADAITEAVGEAVANKPIRHVYQVLDIHSPSKVYEEIGENVMLGFVQGIQGQESLAIQSIKETIQNIISAVDPTFTPTLNTDGLVSGLESVIIKLTEIADRFATINKVFETVGNLKIPALATGGVVPANALVTKANDISQDSITSLVTALAGLSTNRTDNSGRSNESKVIAINIDGREVFNAVVAENDNQIRRTGRSLLMP